jgi:Ca-activated chloride channel family protein
MRIGMAMVAAAALLAIAAAQEPAKPQESVFRSATRTVAVYATVSDAQGRLVPDLTREDFEIYDEGRLQPITLFENGSQPITVVLLLDRSGSMVGNFNLVRSGAEQFVAALRPGDKARIGSFANRIQLDPRDFTSNKRDLIAILRTELQEAGPTPLWNAVNVGITALLHQDGRRVVLVFTDGVDRPDGNNNISFRDVARNAAREDVMVYAIGLAGRLGYGGRRRGTGGFGGGVGGGGTGTGRGGLGQPVEMSKPDPGLPKIATETGGGYFELTSANNMSATFIRIADELHRQYALAFTPSRFDGKTHKIEVRIRRPDLTARARKTYVARKDEEE